MKKALIITLGSGLLISAIGWMLVMQSDEAVAKEETTQSDPTGKTSTAAKDLKFYDVADDYWGATDIYDAVKNGVVDGFPDLSFQPEINVTRAQYIKMVVAAAKVKQPYTQNDKEAWYTPFVKAAVDAGLLRTGEFTDELLDQTIPRVEMAKIAVRSTNAAFRDPNLTLTDDAVMGAAVSAGIIHGLIGGELAPQGSTTRAQSVTVISRIQKILGGTKLEVDPYAASNAELALKKTNIFTVMPEFFGGSPRKPWNISNMVLETPDGLYKGVIDRIVAVDLNNPDDPNRNILGDISTVTWTAGGGKFYNVTDYPDSYMLVIERRTIFNYDKNIYGDSTGGPIVSLLGIAAPNTTEQRTGVLNSSARLHDANKDELRGLIIPKHGLKFTGSLILSVNAPAIPPNNNYYQDLLMVSAPQDMK